MLFGHQIKYAVNVISAKKNPLDMGPKNNESDDRIKLAQQYSKIVMQIVISILAISCSFYLLISSENVQVQKASSGFIGTIIGYWLR